MKKFFFNVVNNILYLKKFELFLLFNKLIKFNLLLKINFIIKKIFKNICFDSGNKRSFNTFFFLSRMSIKKNMNLSLINGLKKIS